MTTVIIILHSITTLLIASLINTIYFVENWTTKHFVIQDCDDKTYVVAFMLSD